MINPFRILHVFPSFEVGGAQRRVVSQINAKTGNFTHSVFAMDGCYDALSLIKDIGPIPEMPPAVKKANMASSVRTCRRLLADYDPDLLVTYNWGSVEWALANRFVRICPSIHIQDGFGKEEQSKELPRRRVIRSFAYRGCDAVIVPSHALETVALENWHIKHDRLHYVPNGIDIDRFICPPDPVLMKKFGLTHDDRIIGTVAGLRPEKNLTRLIDTFSKIAGLYQGAKLVIVGSGSEGPALKAHAEKLGVANRVVFTGALENPEAIIPTFEIFALSSDTEQMPLSVIEAMACGLPIVSTDVGDIRQMVCEENQRFIQGRDSRGLAQSLSAMLERRDTGLRIGAANQQKAKQEFSVKAMVDQYEALFWEAVRDFKI
ncbi:MULTISPECIES: glycosyltransferase family 4 protein [Kordiimonas]|uniref:Glycosyltransferase involved in cell wall bisynthesis n=1 Tax=Kordiimonas lacus TaxID=637679 RepID=A0A1G7DQS5_9PROT|nr:MULTISPECIES: glycosyltransferase family 4 protein [Kordiimonas]SDE53205.1 Glycosyltransferase involved in cell wall bisynthesis [Kordiimonas lacus]